MKGNRVVCVVANGVIAALLLNIGMGPIAAQPETATVSAPAPRECVPAVFVHGILGANPFANPPNSPPPLDSPQVPLYNELKANGYVMNETLFGFSYDWTQDNNIPAARLNDYIENVVKTSIQKRTGTRPNKVALIAHSMGGFVSRRYYAMFGQGKADQLLTVDNPYGGAADVFIDFGGLNGHFSQHLDSAVQLYPTWQAVFDQFGGAVPSNGVPQGYNPYIQNSIWTAPQPDVDYYSRDNQTTDTVTRDFQRIYDIFGNLVAQYTYWTVRTMSLGDGRVLERSATAQIAPTAKSPRIIHGNHTGTIPYTFPTDPSRGSGGVVESAAPLILDALQKSTTGGPDECAKYSVKVTITPRTTFIPACTPSAYQVQLFDAKTQQGITALAQGEKMRIDVGGTAVGTGYFTVTTPTHAGVTTPAKGPGNVSVVARVYDKDGAKLGEGGNIAIIELNPAPIHASACGPIEAVFDDKTCGWKYVSTKARPCLPDDTLSTATILAPATFAYPAVPAAQPAVNATIAVLDNGYGDTMRALLKKQGIGATPVPIDFSPEIVTQYPVLIVPTGGLNGYAQSDAMRARLAQYVTSGGVIIAFAQENGDEYALFPGGKLRGYGYDQDVNCRVDSARIATFAPMLISQPSEVLSLNIDGFFTDWDRATTTVLLNRTLNGSPAMLVYPFGQGYVLATSAYPDTASEQGLGTSDDVTTLRDLVTWALNPALSVDRFGANQSVTIPLTATNRTPTGTAYLVYTIYDATGQSVLSTDPITLALTSGQTRLLTTSLPITQLQSGSANPYGYWHVQLKLLDAGYGLAQSDDYDYRFATARFTQAQQGYGYPDQPYAVTINSAGNEFVYGASPLFTFNVFNNTTQTKTLRLDYASGAFVQDITRTITLSVPASASIAYSDTLPALALSGQVAADLYLNGQLVAHAQRPFAVNYTPLAQTVTTDKPFYSLGDIPVLTVTNQSQTQLPFTVTAALKILDRNNQAYFNDTRTLTVTPFVPVVYTLTLPALNSQNWGYYGININNLINAVLPVGTIGQFIVPPLAISTDLVTLPRIATSSTITFTNMAIGAGSLFQGAIGGQIVSTTFAISLTRPNGSMAWAAIQSLPILTSGVSITTVFTVGDIGPVEFGNYTLNYAISSPNGYKWVQVHRLMPAQDAFAQYSNQIFYHVRDQVVLNTNILNIGLFDLNPLVTVNLTDLGISATQALTVPAGSGVVGVFPLTFTLPTTASEGSHYILVTVKQASGVHQRSSAIYIQPLNVSLASASLTAFNAGQTAPVTVTNTGGVDALLPFTLTLRNGGRNLIVLQNLAGLNLPVGAAVVLTPVIPADATTGAYRFELTGVEVNSGQPVDVFAPVSIVNTTISVTGRTDQQLYLTTDTITVTGRITSTQLPVSGTLGLTIGSDGLSQYWQTYNTGNSSLFNNSVTAVATDPAGNTYFGVNAMGYSGADVRINQLMPDLLTWQTYSLPPALAGVSAVKHIAVGPDQRVWVATNAGAAVLSADRTTWTTYLASTSPLVNNWVNAVTVAPNGDVWFGTINGANLYTTGGQWVTYTVANGLPSNYIYAIKQDGAGNTWFGTNSGLAEFTHAGAWITYTSGNSGLLSNAVVDIDFDAAGNIWLATPPVVTQGGVSALLAAGGWLTFTTSNSGLAGPNVTAISVGADRRKWIGYNTLGISVLSVDNANWQTYASPVIGSNTVNGLAQTPGGDIWVATQPGVGIGGASRGYALAGEKNILWMRSVPVNLGTPGAITDVSALTATSLGVTGRLTLRTVVTAASGYVVGVDTQPFYIYPGGPVLTLNADRTVYLPGQPLNVSGILLNNTGSTLTGQAITITLSGATIYTTSLFTLANGATTAFTVSATAPISPGQFALTALTPLRSIAQTPRVVSPGLAVSLDLPVAVGSTPYTATVILTNTGELPLNLAVALSASTLRPDVGLALAPGDVVALPNTISGGMRTITATISGDVTRVLARTLPWGEGATIGIGAPAGNVQPGPALITYTVVNTGVLAFNQPFTITLDGAPVFTTMLALQPVQSSTGEVAVNPAPGAHTVLARTPYAQQSATWMTLAAGGARVTIDAVQSPVRLTGAGTLTATLTNRGLVSFDGTLAVTTTFFYADTPFSLAAGETRDIGIPLDVTHAPAGGTYLVGVIASSSSAVLDQTNRNVQVIGAEWQVTIPPPTLTAGQTTILPVTVTNAGGLASPYILTFDLDGIYAATRPGSAAPGASTVYSFAVSTPGDIEARSSTGHARINATDQAFTYTIAGPQLALGALLTPRVAPEGTPVSLTLFITDTTGLGAPIPLVARAAGASDSQAQSLTLVNSAHVTFVFTAPQSDVLLSFGAYHTSGRSLLLDTRRLYVVGDPRGPHPLVIYPDHSLYHPGDIVVFTALAAISGTLDWQSLDVTGTLALVPGVPMSFNVQLPTTLGPGTYAVMGHFTGSDGRNVDAPTAFEVDSDSVSIKHVTLNVAIDANVCAGAVTPTLKLDTRAIAPMNGVTVEWNVFAPNGALAGITQTQIVTLPAGVTWWTLPPVNFTSNQGGTHLLTVNLHKGNTQLASTIQAFDVGNAALLGLTTSRAYYRPGQTLTATAAVLNPLGLPLTLTSWLNGSPASQRAIAYGGYTAASLPLGTIPPGTLSYSVTLTGAICRSVVSRELITAPLPAVDISIDPVTGDNGWHTITPTVQLVLSDAYAPLHGRYAWDGGVTQATETGDATTTLSDGTHVISATAVTDDGANAGPITATVKIDRLPPLVSAIIVSSTLTVTLIATDTTSGLAAIMYRINVGAWQTYTTPLQFTSMLDYRAVDKAGNISAVGTLIPTLYRAFLPLLRKGI